MDGFDALSVVLHHVGDGAVEVLEEDQERQISWKTGLETMWLAADGCMENRIELLTQFLVINNLEAGHNADNAKQLIQTAFDEQHDAAARMFSTKKFEIPAPAQFGERTVSAAYWDLEARHKQLIMEYVDLMTTFQSMRRDYSTEAAAFLSQVQDIAKGAAQVAQAEIAARQSQAESLGLTLAILVAVTCIASIAVGFFVAKVLARRLGILQQRMEAIADGDADLRQRLELSGKDEVAATGAAFDRFLDTMSGVVQELNEISNAGYDSSQSLNRAATDLAGEANSQAATFQQLSSSMIEVSTSCSNAADHTRTVGTHSEDATTAARDGAAQTQQLEELVSEIRASSNEVAAVIRVIDDIAFQTNLLALNAAVEAARAGDAGKGFAVVAEEVRGLAQRSAQAARDTSQLIQTATERADNGAERAVTVTAKLQEIVEAYEKVETVLVQISTTTEEQNNNIHSITDAIQDVERGLQRTSETTTAVSDSASEVGSQMTRIRELVTRFQV